MATQFSIQDDKPWKATFFTIWGGQAISLLGSQLVQFALIWYLTVSTGSATVLATASLAGMLPGVILGPFIGTLVDRWNRRLIMLLSDSLIALATIVLAVLFALHVTQIWHIYVVLFVRSLAGSFHGNAMSASTSLMVPVENLTRIQGINQMLTGGLNVVAAPLGALLLEALPIQGILVIDVVTAVFAVTPLVFIKVPQPERIAQKKLRSEPQTTVWQDFGAGLRYLLGWPGLLIISLMAVGINLVLTPGFALLPLLVKDNFGGNAIQLGWLESAMGIGIIIGGGLLGVWGGFKRKILTSLIGLLGIGIGALIIALAPSTAFFLVVIGVLFIGLMLPITNGPIFAAIQLTVEPDMQARILSLLMSVSMGMTPIGLLVAGPAADRFGIQAWFLIAGLLCIVMGMTGMFIPAVMNIEAKRVAALNEQSLNKQPV